MNIRFAKENRSIQIATDYDTAIFVNKTFQRRTRRVCIPSYQVRGRGKSEAAKMADLGLIRLRKREPDHQSPRGLTLTLLHLPPVPDPVHFLQIHKLSRSVQP